MSKKKQVGKLSPEELTALTKKHGELTEITVRVSDTEDSVCYLKRPERMTISKALSLVTKSQLLEAGEIILGACFVAGDERCKVNLEASPEDEQISIAACMRAARAVEILDAEVKKISK